MRVVLFCHSLVSDWNHGNAHFLRGVVSELMARGHDVDVFEPEDGWSRKQLEEDAGIQAITRFHDAFPHLKSTAYRIDALDIDAVLDGVDLVLVHEWNSPDLVRRLGRHRRTASYRLLFHDTHHRAVTDPEAMAAYDLTDFDGVLAFGNVIRDLYLERGWAQYAWTWHEAADVRVFYPRPPASPATDVVWVGNWGDDERTAELESFLLEPVHCLGLSATVFGVRYPELARRSLQRFGFRYGGWIANYDVPDTFSRHRMTVHVPRRPYVEALPGIPTIRPFEALACGIPLISAPWDDVEGLFRAGRDFLTARNANEMIQHMHDLKNDSLLAESLTSSGLEIIKARHTCAHRVDELLSIADELGVNTSSLPYSNSIH